MAFAEVDEDRHPAIFAASLAQSIRHHTCAFNISQFDVTVDESHIGDFITNPELSAAVDAGILSFYVKGRSMLPTIAGSTFAWQAVYQNLALLRHWGSESLMFFFDTDELIQVAQDKGFAHDSIMKEALRNHSSLIFRRRDAICSNCFGDADVMTPGGLVGKNLSVSMRTHSLDKLAVASAVEAGCAISVHWANCMTKNYLISTDVAFIVHLVNAFQIRMKSHRANEAVFNQMMPAC